MKEPRNMSFGELMSWLGNAQPGSTMRPCFEAEYERRKTILQRWAVVIAALGLLFGLAHSLGVFDVMRLVPK
jgi:hypothetical protein